MSGDSRWRQLQGAAGPRLRATTDAVQPLGLRLASSAATATRGGFEKLPPQLQQRLGIEPPKARNRSRQTVAVAGALVAAAAAAEGSRRGRELQQLAEQLARLSLDVREFGGRRARQRAQQQRRRRQLALGCALGLATATAVAARAASRRRASNETVVAPEPASNAAGEAI